MIAVLQRSFIFGLLTLALSLAWWAWWYGPWPQSFLLAVAVGLVPAGLLLAVLALEFVLMHHHNRRDPAPPASLAQVLRAWWVECRAAWQVFGWRQPFFSNRHADHLPALPNGQRGVVLIHGFMCNRGLWWPWYAALRARGHAYVAVNLEPVWGSIDAYGEQIDAAVRRVAQATGQAPVLVCHSMGGLAARAWLQACQADDRVHRVLTLGTPHGGTWLARLAYATNARQMLLGGPWIQALAQAEPAGRARRFVCWYSHCDNIVFPASTATLAGADNRHVAGVGHVQMVLEPRVIRACLEEIAR